MMSKRFQWLLAALLCAAAVAGGILVYQQVRETLRDRDQPAKVQTYTRPALSDITQPQQVFANGEIYPNICVTVVSTPGHRLRVVFSTNKNLGGKVMPSRIKLKSHGSDRICTAYHAPTTKRAVGTNAFIQALVYDRTAKQRSNPLVTVPFWVLAAPSRP